MSNSSSSALEIALAPLAVGLHHLQHGADVVLDVEAAEDRRLLRQIADAEPGALVHRQRGDVVAVELDAAAVGFDQPGDHVEDRGLAGAVRVRAGRPPRRGARTGSRPSPPSWRRSFSPRRGRRDSCAARPAAAAARLAGRRLSLASTRGVRLSRFAACRVSRHLYRGSTARARSSPLAAAIARAARRGLHALLGVRHPVASAERDGTAHQRQVHPPSTSSAGAGFRLRAPGRGVAETA